MIRLLPLLAVLGGCPGDPDPDTDTDTDSDTDTDTDSDTDTDTDTTPQGTDADRDTWTVEAGDCDDDDPFVNPSFPERPTDDKDNDCDGRVDETFDGLLTWQVFADASGPAAVRSVSLLGDLGPPGAMPASQGAASAVEVIGEDRWLVLDAAAGVLRSSDAQGAGSALVTFPPPDDEAWVREPHGLFGLGRDRQGTTYVTTANQLVAVQDDGTWEIVADWPCLDDAEGTTMCPVALTVQATTGHVALFGAFGGAGMWTPEDGLVVEIPDDPDARTGSWDAARSDEQGRLYALGTVEIDGEDVRGVFRWNRTTNAFVLRGPWIASNGAPPGGFSSEWRFGGFDIDTIRGEYYVSANVGTNRRAIYRIFDGEDGYAALLWPETFAATPPPADEGQEFHALVVRWDQD